VTEQPIQQKVVSPVVAARSAYGNAIRSGDPDTITAARASLAAAKAEQLRLDSEAILSEPVSRDVLRITAVGEERVTREEHDALFASQHREAQRFLQDNGPAHLWDALTKDLHSKLLNRHRAAHRSLGCKPGSPCRGELRG